MLLIFSTMAVTFTILPRSTYSELERRELATFPDFSIDSLLSGAWTRDVSAWFSDTEPYRDEFMTLNMAITSHAALNIPLGDGDDVIAFHATETGGGDPGAEAALVEEAPIMEQLNAPLTIEMPESTDSAATDVEAKMASSGILVVGKAPDARALMVFGASAHAGKAYADAINQYRTALGNKVKIYCMPIPTSIEFYCPEKAKKVARPQIATINNIFSLLQGVTAVDCYTPLSRHKNEDIYLRTDHHWAPLGAYYAAKAFAETAKVPFVDISKYDSHTVHNFVGTMYGYSKDISVKQSPEDFVFYTPNGVDYTTTYRNYNVDKGFHVHGIGKPYKGKYFQHYKDGSGAAYSTFMGGDTKLTQVKTSTNNGRKLLILKDSFGNAVPGYLFFSFEEIHVVDFRYFTSNIVDYVNEHGITDVLFTNGIFNSCGSTMANNYKRFLRQTGGPVLKSDDKDSKEAKDKGTKEANESDRSDKERPADKKANEADKKNDSKEKASSTADSPETKPVKTAEPKAAPMTSEPAPAKEEPSSVPAEPAPAAAGEPV